MGNHNSGRRPVRRIRPATTTEGRESQLISLADSLAERQMREGTASAQVITHFLKLGSTREKLEQQRLINENLLLSAKIEQINSGQRMEELYAAALGAMREYKGEVQDDNYEG
jgi:hypothetical protein